MKLEIFNVEKQFSLDPKQASVIELSCWLRKEKGDTDKSAYEFGRMLGRNGIIIGSNIVPNIKKVIFNNPCTIVLWADGTKTIVRSQDGDNFDTEKGLAMAISKKAFGNDGNYYDKLKEWLEKAEGNGNVSKQR